jgi:hypothetical protein
VVKHIRIRRNSRQSTRLHSIDGLAAAKTRGVIASTMECALSIIEWHKRRDTIVGEKPHVVDNVSDWFLYSCAA